MRVQFAVNRTEPWDRESSAGGHQFAITAAFRYCIQSNGQIGRMQLTRAGPDGLSHRRLDTPRPLIASGGRQRIPRISHATLTHFS